MRYFKNFDTGDIWSEEEIRNIYKGEPVLVEAYPVFEDYLEFLLDLGRNFEGGIQEI